MSLVDQVSGYPRPPASTCCDLSSISSCLTRACIDFRRVCLRSRSLYLCLSFFSLEYSCLAISYKASLSSWVSVTCREASCLGGDMVSSAAGVWSVLEPPPPRVVNNSTFHYFKIVLCCVIYIFCMFFFWLCNVYWNVV